MVDNKKIFEIVKEICGEAALEVVKVLRNRRNFSEFKLAERIDRNVNETRNILYTLHQLNLASFIRKKDKKKGWYIYYWSFEPGAIKQLRLNQLKKRLGDLQAWMEREKNNAFFICCNKCVRADFDQASGFQFKCPECGEIMNYESNLENVEKFEKEIKRLEKDIKAVSSHS